MKNIVVLVPSICIGGREKIAINTFNILKEKYNVFFVVFSRQKTEYDFNEKIYDLNVPASKNKIKKVYNQILRVLKLKDFCKKNNIECVFSFGEAANITNILLKKIYKIKSIVSIRGYKELEHTKILKNIIFNSDKTICVSKDMEYKILNIYPNAKNIVVVQNGSFFNINQNKNQFSQDAPKLVSMGRFESIKGFDRLLKTFSIVQKEFPKSILTLIGNGAVFDDLKKLTKELSIENNVYFTGFLKDPDTELVKNDIYVLCSKKEGFPNSLIEAMACGLGIVSLDCPTGPREIISENYSFDSINGIAFEKYGVLVENNESEIENLLSKSIIQLLNKKEKVEYYKNISKERFLDFSIENYKKRIYKILENI